MASHSTTDDHQPLLSDRTILRLAVGVVCLSVMTAAISAAGKYYGHRMALAGHTDDTSPVTMFIGEDAIDLPANMIRFASQRQTARTERADLYLAWPEMVGYSEPLAARFNSISDTGNLIFLQLSQSVMTRDMSGRLKPIYEKLFDGPSQPGPAGLVIHRIKKETGFGDDAILSALQPDGRTYVVRCQLPAETALATDADCQRDLHVGKDLSLIYRFSSTLLPQWREIDSAVTEFARRHVRN